MSDRPFFPLFVDLSKKKIIFIGAGKIAKRRIEALMPFVTEINIFSPEVDRSLAEILGFSDKPLSDHDSDRDINEFTAVKSGCRIRLSLTEYSPECLNEADIVFACTSDPGVNNDIAAECRRLGIMVNVASDHLLCDFYFPGISQHEEIVVGINAGGKSHFKVKAIRKKIDRIIEENDY